MTTKNKSQLLCGFYLSLFILSYKTWLLKIIELQNHRIKVSRNHRVVWFWRDLKNHLTPPPTNPPCPGKGDFPVQQVAHSPIQPDLKHFQGWCIQIMIMKIMPWKPKGPTMSWGALSIVLPANWGKGLSSSTQSGAAPSQVLCTALGTTE